MRLIFPCAGLGTRTQDYFREPKPFISIQDKTLVEMAAARMPWDQVSEVIYVFNEIHAAWLTQDLIDNLRKLSPEKCRFSTLFTSTTSGQAETVAKALETCEDLSLPLLVGNCDTLVAGPWPDFHQAIPSSLGLFSSSEPSFSYARIVKNRVVETAEKKVISNYASSGIYFFNSSSEFLRLLAESSPQVESFIAPLYNSLIATGDAVSYWMHEKVTPLGTSSEIRSYLHSEGGAN